jgi:hypothetical protein
LNDKFERMWGKAVTAYFQVLSGHLLEGTEENYKTFAQITRYKNYS